MSASLFGQIVLLIVIFSVSITAARCLHDKFCTMCKCDKK